MTYNYVAIDNAGKEILGSIVAVDQIDAIKSLKDMGLFPTRINETKGNTKTMNLAQALKQKNRLAGELVRQQQILQRENARRSDSVSKVDRKAVWIKILELSEQLGELKGKITVANVGIYPVLERMAELKSRVAYLTNLNKREGPEVEYVGRDQEKVEYKWESFIGQERADELTAELQQQINDLQDKVDAFNATTTIQ